MVRGAYEWKPDGKRLLGRPKKRLMDVLNEDFRTLGVYNLMVVACNRKEWKKLC